MATLGISYCKKEQKIEYNHVYLHAYNTEEIIFDSGNFIKDWYNATKAFLEISKRDSYLFYSSSVNDFISDGAEYEIAYVGFKDDNDVDGELFYEHKEESIKMFVSKGSRPTWEELKTAVK